MNQEFVLEAELFSEKLNTLESVTIPFPSPPLTFQDVKSRIEDSCGVPVSVQTIYYQGNRMLPDSSPASSYVRSGDTIRVCYPVKGETKKVQGVVEWLRESTSVLREIRKMKPDAAVRALRNNAVLSDPQMQNFSRGIFCPYSNPVKYVNSLYFTSLGGIKLLAELHHHVILLRRENCQAFMVVYLEHICCQACADYSMFKECAEILSKSGELENCISTFLKKPANDSSLAINHEHSTIDIALCAIFNITELPDIQLKVDLSLRKDVINQCFLAGYSSIYKSCTSITIISFFLSLSRCTKAHENLLQPDFIEGIIKICQSQASRKTSQGARINEEEILALKSYAGVVFAQMIRGSPDLLLSFPESTLEKMEALISDICKIDPAVIRRYETEQEFYWETFVDCVQYLYMPNIAPGILKTSSLVGILCSSSIEMLLHYLQSTLGRSIHVDIVVKENLLDYIVMLPWIVPVCYRERANKVVRELVTFQQVQPPTLFTIAKSVLAKQKFGLEKLMHLHSISDLSTLVHSR